ncbi:glycoside hydrolase domain-containing protein [Alkalihalobacillus sp. LMS39]|uniref:glycoside hydrolase domain-containing protein n=1 Tax=Alkalihalobacillus sp. LMS39 TaxID=2924032 RepID=UPI001FB4B60D|nr:glycoside hydrolase domain-containing protein [Alkalihalobacillus sp. LMS39]UOE92596.1 DUF1906 domain-containing protein [Alkalihalobacillus sp. LMS39]
MKTTLRQYIILGITYVLALASFYFFVVNQTCDCTKVIVQPVIEEREEDETSEPNGDEDTANGTDENGESQDESNGTDENGDSQDDSNGTDENGDSQDESNGTDENGDSQDDSNGTDENGDSQDEQDTTVREEASGDDILWGVDSASLTTEDFYRCVTTNFGDPEIWGRYLEDKEGVSYGLTPEEVELLHREGVSILVIYNHFTDGTTYDKGVAEAELAIEYAENIGVPEGVAIFANVEPFYPIDSGFIQGWYDTIEPSIYTPAIYGVFAEDGDNDVRIAFEGAVEENPDILDNVIIWTNQPQIGITTEDNAPEFNPAAPGESLAWAYQYGIDAETCNIDTVLYQSSILDYVWRPDQ